MPDTPSDRLAALHARLDEVLDLSPEERASRIERLRGEDPAGAAALERLLAGEAALDASRFLAEGPGPGLQSGLAGQPVGAYILERPLAQGGMGTVWLARRSDGRFEGTVAVKLLKLALLDPLGAERFQREGTVLARLGHPHIARLLDAGVTATGQPYLVLEFVDGQRIDRYCDEHRLPPEDRIRLFLDVLAAVGHAHANLIVHRDLKPSNIFVTHDGTPKLLDFGIAKLLEDESVAAGPSTLTNQGGQALTPEYAAPEQVTAAPVTTATDVYALGVLLYRLLSGRHPTGGGAGSAAEQLQRIVENEPPRLSASVSPEAAAMRRSSPDRLRRLYRGDLDNILARALRKNWSDRYATVGEFAEDLRRYLRHEPVAARPDSLAYRAGKFLRRYRAAVGLAGLVTLALLVATVITTRALGVARRQRDEAVYQARRAGAIRDFQTALISQIGTTPLSLHALLDNGVRLLDRHPPSDPRLEAALLMQFADRYGELELHPEERNLLGRADSAAGQSGDRELQATIACALAGYHSTLGQGDSAALALARARAVAGPAKRLTPEVQAACVVPDASLLASAGQRDSAIGLVRSAMAALTSARLGGTVEYYMLQTELAEYLRSAGRVREAIALNSATRDGLARLGLDGSLLAASNNNDLAQMLFQLGERRAGLDVLRDVLEATREADPAGGVHPVVAFNYATQFAAIGRTDSARYWYQAAARAARAGGSLEAERRSMVGVARTAAHLALLPEADAAFARVLRIARRQHKAIPRESLFVAASLALAHGDTVTAIRMFTDVLRADGFFDGRHTPASRPPLLELAGMAVGQGRVEDALGFARALRELATRDSVSAGRSADVGEADLLAAEAHARGGSPDSARIEARRALGALAVGAGSDSPLTLRAAALIDSLH